ncbi:hypothetical protein Tco_0987750 [Tanacetum coccineum]
MWRKIVGSLANPSTTNTQVSPASTQVSTANLSDDTIYAFLASQPNGSQLVYEDLEQIHEDDIEEMDLKWQLALLSMRTRSYMADDEVPTNMALMAFSDSEVHNDKTCSKTCLKSFETLKTQLDDLRIEFNKSEFNFIAIINGVRSVEENLSFTKRMSLDKLIRSQILDKTRKGVGFINYNAVPPPPTGLFSPTNLDLSYSGLEEFQQLEFEGYGPKPSKSVSEDISNEVRESPDSPLIEELVSDDKLEKKTVFTTVAKIEFVRPKQQEKPVRKPVKYAEMYKSQSPRGNQRNWNNQMSQQLGSGPLEKVVSENNYTRVNYNYSSKKAHPSAHKNMVPRAVLMKTGPGHLQKEDQGYVDSGCSRHMTGNMSYLSDFKEFNGRYVTFGGGAKGGKITGKETLKTGKLDFEDVYFVKELQFNLFSVSQMCDKKNSVLFTDTGCFVLSPDFKLADESRVLLKVSRKNNIYNVDCMKNIVPERVFLEDKPIIAGDGPKWLFDIDVLRKSMNYVPVVADINSNDFVDGLLFDSSSKNASNNEPQPSNDAEKKDDEGGIDDQERTENSDQDVNTTGPSINTASTNFNTGSLNINIVSPTVPIALLESTYADFFGDESELDLSNIATTYLVPTTPNTRIHKDHSLDHVIGDMQSGV